MQEGIMDHCQIVHSLKITNLSQATATYYSNKAGQGSRKGTRKEQGNSNKEVSGQEEGNLK